MTLQYSFCNSYMQVFRAVAVVAKRAIILQLLAYINTVLLVVARGLRFYKSEYPSFVTALVFIGHK